MKFTGLLRKGQGNPADLLPRMATSSTYKCDTCSKIFTQYSQYIVHMRQHTGDKPFSCEYCKKGFASAKVLKVHIRTHTGERPYKCPYCDRCFSAYANLVVHRRIHTNEKPYVCKLCCRAFEHSGNLSRHYQAHLTDDGFRCILCSKTFVDGDELLHHTKESHTIDYERYVSHATPANAKRNTPRKTLREPSSDVQKPTSSVSPETTVPTSTSEASPNPRVLNENAPHHSPTRAPSSHHWERLPVPVASPRVYHRIPPNHLRIQSSRPPDIRSPDLDKANSRIPVIPVARRYQRPQWPDRSRDLSKMEAITEETPVHPINLRVERSRPEDRIQPLKIRRYYDSHLRRSSHDEPPASSTRVLPPFPKEHQLPRSAHPLPPLIPISSSREIPDEAPEYRVEHKKLKVYYNQPHHDQQHEPINPHLYKKRPPSSSAQSSRPFHVLIPKLATSIKSCFEEVVTHETDTSGVWNRVERMFVSILEKSELNMARCLEVNSEQLLIHFLDAVGENPCADVRVSEKRRMEINVRKLVQLSFER